MIERLIEQKVRGLLIQRAAHLLHPDHFDFDVDERHELFSLLADRIASTERARAQHRELIRLLSLAEQVTPEHPMAHLTKSQRRTIRRKLGLTGTVPVGRPPQMKHGTPGMVRKGCKCDECAAWRRERSRLDRRRRAERCTMCKVCAS